MKSVVPRPIKTSPILQKTFFVIHCWAIIGGLRLLLVSYSSGEVIVKLKVEVGNMGVLDLDLGGGADEVLGLFYDVVDIETELLVKHWRGGGGAESVDAYGPISIASPPKRRRRLHR